MVARSRFSVKLLLKALCVVVALTASVRGANAAQAPSSGDDIDQYGFAQFLDAHPNVATVVDATPTIFADQGALQQYPELVEYLNSHDGLREQLTQGKATWLAALEQQYHTAINSGALFPRTAIVWFEHYLEHNPKLKTQLHATPQLISDPVTLKQYLPLENFLSSYPFFPVAVKRFPALFIDNSAWQ